MIILLINNNLARRLQPQITKDDFSSFFLLFPRRSASSNVRCEKSIKWNNLRTNFDKLFVFKLLWITSFSQQTFVSERCF